MISCILVDDERTILKELEQMLLDLEVSVLQLFNNPYDALDSMDNLEPDLAFLDIEMPGINGIELAKRMHLKNPNLHIVFLTAYNNYSIEAFGVGAIHYLLKPTNPKALASAITRVERFKRIQSNHNSFSQSSMLPNNGSKPDRICLMDHDDIIILHLSDILYFSSLNSITTIVTKSGEYTTRKPLNHWEHQLKSHDFIRCHKSYIINANYIHKIIHMLGDQKEIELSYCKILIPISRRKLKDIKKWLGL
jgi:DNA-binding LytR/AlgR family response regulator